MATGNQLIFGNVFRGKRIWLTGDTGFKGSWLAFWLRRLGADVLGVGLEPESADGPFVRAKLDQARQALEQGRVLPLRQVLDKIEREQRGQVLKIEFEHDDGRYIYEIRLLQADGRMAKLKVDAVDGKLLSIKRKERD